jgi:uncharacterized membrane protein YhiD involved in acid resistance
MDDLARFIEGMMGTAPLARLLLAAVLGALIGIERESRAKPAGLRTVVLICMGAELFTEASLLAGSMNITPATRTDPGRIAAQIVTGVGFLGAGTILVHREKVVGLTTAASIWLAAAIGTAVGFSMFLPAVGGTLMVLAILSLVGRFEARLLEQEAGILTLEVTGAAHPLVGPQLDGAAGMEGVLLDLKRGGETTRVMYRYQGHGAERAALTQRLFDDERVRSFGFE